jgi:hypothetical protein
MLADRPKLLLKGKVFLQDNNFSYSAAKMRHTHAAFTMMHATAMKALLGDDEGLEKMIITVSSSTADVNDVAQDQRPCQLCCQLGKFNLN